MLTIKLAEEIVHQTMLRLHHNINVISTNGVILASGDKMRIEDLHEGALHVAKTKKTLIINEKNIDKYPNTKPGINMPIMYKDDVLGVIGITGDSKKLKEIANLVQLTTEMMAHQALAESKSEWQRKNNDYIFESLVNGSNLDASLQERIHKLSFPLTAPFQILLLNLDEQTFSSNNLPLFFEDLFYKQPVLSGHNQLHEYYILLTHCDEMRQQSVIKALQKKQQKTPALRIGVGPVVEQLNRLPNSYYGAKTALEFAFENNPITFFEEIELFSLFKKRDSDEVRAFENRALQNMTTKLIETLQAFFSCNLKLNLCAQKLNIHRHTLTYRLNKIKEITGYDPQFFEDAVILNIACALRIPSKKERGK